MRVSIASGLPTRPRSSAKIGKNRFEVCCQRRNALALRADGQQFLLEIQIQRQGRCDVKRKRRLIDAGNILRSARQSENFMMHLKCSGTILRRRISRLIGNEQHLRSKKGTLLVEFEHLKALAPLRNQVEAPIGILFGDRNDFSGAPDLGDSFLQRAYHAKVRAVGPALSDHLFVAWLENVQRQWRAGKQYDLEREQRQQRHEISGSPAWKRASLDCTTWVRGPRLHLDLPRGGEYNASMELAGQVVVVTGASMGIGEAIARTFAEEGASVVLLSRDSARAEAARTRIGFPDRTIALSCDVRNSEEIDRVLALTLHHFKSVDVWVNNAGHGLLDSVAQMEMAACHDMFETNFFGAVSAMQAVIPVMRQQGGGTIINISSVAGHVPLPFHAAYSATKFALNAIGKAAGVELKKDGIRVLTVCPGYVATAFGANAIQGRELKKVRPTSVRGVSAERVARATLRGYLKQKREVIVPWTMHVPVKLYQLFPAVVEWAMSRMAG